MVEPVDVRPQTGRGVPRRLALGAGAAEGAPTAPHATPRTEPGARTGPERFWARGRARIALAVSAALSLLLHVSFVPLGVPAGFVVNDVEGDPAIPIDILTGEPPAAAAAPPPPSEAPETPPAPAEPAPPSSARVEPARADDAGPHDGASDAPVDGRADTGTDAHPDAVADAFSEGSSGADIDGASGGVGAASTRDGGPDARGDLDAASADAGSGEGRDPESIVAAETVRADVVLVALHVNAEVIRAHPVGAQMGYLLKAIPQWDDFLSGTEIDPVHDIDWVLISGPSLKNTTNDSVLIHYSASDLVIDKAVAAFSRRYDHGGAFDAGVRGLKAALAHADRGERVIFRPQPHLLAVVPPRAAIRYAHALMSARVVEHPHPKEAVYLSVSDPHHPFPDLPDSITQARLRVFPAPEAGAEVFLEGDTKSAEAALEAAADVRRLIRRTNTVLLSIVSHGLLDHVEVTTDGPTVHVRLTATRDQLEAALAFAAGYLGVSPPASAEAPAPLPPASRGSPSPVPPPAGPGPFRPPPPH
jgi:hypothetical protein